MLPENRDELFRWLAVFSKLNVLVIVKFRMGVIKDYTPVLDYVERLNLFGVHFNVRNESTMKPDFDFVRRFRESYDTFLLASGYVRSPEDARKLFKAGADMVGVAQAVLQDSNYIQNIADNLKAV